MDDLFELRLGQHIEVLGLDAEPLGAHLDLGRRFLARDIERLAPKLRYLPEHLEHERGLADARVAADQHHGSGNDPAAEHAVELADLRDKTVLVPRLDLAQEERFGAALAL